MTEICPECNSTMNPAVGCLSQHQKDCYKPPEVKFQIRYGTQDQEIFDAVVANNQYHLADRIPADALIIDIGANIGCFAVACLLRGAGTIVCFEPSQENFAQLTDNVAAWPGQVVAFLAGVWKSDEEQKISFSSVCGTASGCCFPTDVEVPAHNAARVNAIGLDEIITQCTNNGERRIQLLKVDAEYSEYPILYSCTKLDLIDEIIGETHEFNKDGPDSQQWYNHPNYKNNATDMCRFLTDHGFIVTTERESHKNCINTLFFATRNKIANLQARVDRGEVLNDCENYELLQHTPEHQ